MRLVCAAMLFVWAWSGVGADPADPADSTGFTRNELRITNRRWISHMLYERCPPNHCITMLASHPGLWAWHADSFPLKYVCPGPAECMELMRRLDEHLVSGENVLLIVDGNLVREIRLLSRGQ